MLWRWRASCIWSPRRHGWPRLISAHFRSLAAAHRFPEDKRKQWQRATRWRTRNGGKRPILSSATGDAPTRTAQLPPGGRQANRSPTATDGQPGGRAHILTHALRCSAPPAVAGHRLVGRLRLAGAGPLVLCPLVCPELPALHLRGVHRGHTAGAGLAKPPAPVRSAVRCAGGTWGASGPSKTFTSLTACAGARCRPLPLWRGRFAPPGYEQGDCRVACHMSAWLRPLARLAMPASRPMPPALKRDALRSAGCRGLSGRHGAWTAPCATCFAWWTPCRLRAAPSVRRPRLSTPARQAARCSSRPHPSAPCCYQSPRAKLGPKRSLPTRPVEHARQLTEGGDSLPTVAKSLEASRSTLCRAPAVLPSSASEKF